jgi:hypothetical protein
MIIPPGGSKITLPSPPAIKDLINGLRGAAQNEDHGKAYEYIAEMFRRIGDFITSPQTSSGTGGGAPTPPPPSTPPTRMIVPFWFAQGENQPASSGLNLNLYDLIFPFEPPVTFTKALWKSATIYNYNSTVPTTDVLIQMYIDGVAIFDTNKLKLPSGTPIETIIVASNFANPSSPIVEHSKITGRMVQDDGAVDNIQVNLVFDLVAQ